MKRSGTDKRWGTKEDKQKPAIWDSVKQVGDMDPEPSRAGWTERSCGALRRE